jgi:hypothetical protein
MAFMTNVIVSFPENPLRKNSEAAPCGKLKLNTLLPVWMGVLALLL